MILKIIAYGDPLLRKLSVDIDATYPHLEELITNMHETMKGAEGVGLAAPQVGLNIKLIVVNSTEVKNNKTPIRQVFINPEITEATGENVIFEEGCLSVPKIHEDILRKEKIIVRYFDENFNEHEDSFDGSNARIIQHEYDHLFGKLFIDKLSPLKKALLKKKLSDIIKGNIDVSYPIKFYGKIRKK